jgi:hypothetical protein
LNYKSKEKEKQEMAEIDEPIFELPPEGRYPAVIDRVDESGSRTTSFGVKRAVKLFFLTNHVGENGKRLNAVVSVNRAIGKGSRLRELVKQITGAEPRRPFDPQSLVGLPTHITVAHVTKGDKTFANVVSITPATAVGTMTRATTTPATGATTTPQKATNQNVAEMEDVSFPYSA